MMLPVKNSYEVRSSILFSLYIQNPYIIYWKRKSYIEFLPKLYKMYLSYSSEIPNNSLQTQATTASEPLKTII